MTSEYLCDPLTIDLDDLKLGVLKGKGRGRGMVKLFNNKKPIQLKTDVMQSSWGVQLNSFKKDEYYIDLSCENQSFMDALKQIDEKLIDEIGSNLSLFEVNEPLTVDDVKKNFLGILKMGNGTPYIRLQLPKNEVGGFDFHIFDENRCEMDFDFGNVRDILKRNVSCKVIFELERVWYFQNRFGIVCKLKQLKLETEMVNVMDVSDASELSVGVNVISTAPQYLILDD